MSDAETTTQPTTAEGAPCPEVGPAIFAYDGSDLAAYAIEQAARQLAPGREALVVCVWQPADVGCDNREAASQGLGDHHAVGLRT